MDKCRSLPVNGWHYNGDIDSTYTHIILTLKTQIFFHSPSQQIIWGLPQCLSRGWLILYPLRPLDGGRSWNRHHSSPTHNRIINLSIRSLIKFKFPTLSCIWDSEDTLLYFNIFLMEVFIPPCPAAFIHNAELNSIIIIQRLSDVLTLLSISTCFSLELNLAFSIPYQEFVISSAIYMASLLYHNYIITSGIEQIAPLMQWPTVGF